MYYSDFKYPSPVRLNHPTLGTIGLCPIPTSYIDAAESSCRSLFGDAPEGKVLSDLFFASEALAAGICRWIPPCKRLFDGHGVRSALTPGQMLDLYRQWSEIQSEHVPEFDKLRRRLSYDIGHVPSVQMDGVVAASVGLEEYYGVGPAELTDSQIAYYIALRATHNKHNEPTPEGRVCLVSREALDH